MFNIETKILKLKTENRLIISSYIYIENVFLLSSPFIIDYDDNSNLIFLEWLPSNIIENDIISIYDEDVLSVLIPKKIILDPYLKCTEDSLIILEEFLSSINNEYLTQEGDININIESDLDDYIYHPPEKGKIIH